RKHATIAPGEGGYVLTDLSTNGLTINGVRVNKSQLLGRGDVLKIGPEEYRFYADVAKAPAPAPPEPQAPALVADTAFGLGSLHGMPQIAMTVIDLEDAII